MRQTSYFALITDQHILEPGFHLYGLDTKSATEALVALIKNEPVQLDGIICLGDLADTALNPNRSTAVAGAEAYAHARELFSDVPPRFLTLPGNHDAPDILPQFFPSQWQRQAHGIYDDKEQNTTLIGLDVRTGPEPTGFATAESVNRLHEVLSESERAIIFSHYPLFDLDNQRINQDLSTINRNDIQKVLQQHAHKISACFHGHLHLWITGYQHGLLSYGVPSSSFTFILDPQGTVVEKVGSDPCGYLLLGINEDGSIFVRPRFLP